MTQINRRCQYGSSWVDDTESLDHLEVPFVERGQITAVLQRGDRHEQIVTADHLASRLQSLLDARVRISGLLRVGNNG